VRSLKLAQNERKLRNSRKVLVGLFWGRAYASRPHSWRLGPLRTDTRLVTNRYDVLIRVAPGSLAFAAAARDGIHNVSPAPNPLEEEKP